MSYCVNCGVELDPSAKKCALCSAPVYNPKETHEKTKDDGGGNRVCCPGGKLCGISVGLLREIENIYDIESQKPKAGDRERRIVKHCLDDIKPQQAENGAGTAAPGAVYAERSAENAVEQQRTVHLGYRISDGKQHGKKKEPAVNGEEKKQFSFVGFR